MKDNSVHPVVAVVIIAVLIGGMAYLFNNVYNGKSHGQVGNPGMSTGQK